MDTLETQPIRRALMGLCACGAMILAGCGGDADAGVKLIPVRGKVTFNGKPLPAGAVTFVPGADRAAEARPGAMVEADGSYVLRTRGREGAPAGTYRVVVRPDVDVKDAKSEPAAIDPRYFTPDKTPLVIEVAEDKPENAYDLNLKVKGHR